MLQELYISNLALIDKASVGFGRGLNVLTGETGAGKTVVVGAVNLLIGGRADASLIRRGCDKAEVQGVFTPPANIEEDVLSDLLDDDGEQLIIRRIVSSDGKNKCYINDRAVTVSTLASVGRRLMDLHGQHEHQSLFKISSHVDFLDKYGGRELLNMREEFRAQSRELSDLKEELTRLKSAEREMLGKRDLLQFQIGEIDGAQLVSGEDDELLRERDILRNAEKLYTAVATAAALLSEGAEAVPATELVAKAVQDLQHVSKIDARLDELTDRLNGLLIEIEDCVSGLRDYGTTLDFPPGRLQEVEDRLAVLGLLKRKYGSTIDEILAYRERAGVELGLCDTSEERATELERSIVAAEESLAELAQRQSDARREFAREFCTEVMRELTDLNMPNARFEVSFIREQDSKGLLVKGERLKVQPNGIDRIEFLVSANKGEPVQPLVKIASGGEISRVMLALKIVLADADEVQTLIFDEVDVGIGGKTATAVGQKMSILARKHQVLAVTHLPQIASFADKHFIVTKHELSDRTITEISEVIDRHRVDEMARLLSGTAESRVSIQHAEELLNAAQETKLG